MNSTLMVVVFIFLYLLLIWKAGKTYPILYLFLLTYFIQYIYSTYLIYFEYRELEYQMTIPSERYFRYAIPAVVALFSGVLLFDTNIDIRGVLKKIDARQAARLGYFLLVVSYLFDVMVFIGVPVGSIASFTSFLKFVAAFCFVFTKSKINYGIIVLIYIQLIVSALQGGVFITFFIWSAYLFFFITIKFQISFWLRSCFILIAIPVLILVQSVKDKYRKESWTGNRDAGVELFTELAEKELQSNEEPFSQSIGVVNLIGRLTQGWHLGMTLKQVPAKVPYANGEEFISDVFSSVVPRVVFSDKKSVGSQEKFQHYTGHRLYGRTSMSIGLLGDFYINFGYWGSFIALFILGAIVARLLNYFILRYVLPDPINIIWVPFILNYLIRANNDFYIFFNGLVKGFILFLIVNYIYKRISTRKDRRSAPVLKS